MGQTRWKERRVRDCLERAYFLPQKVDGDIGRGDPLEEKGTLDSCLDHGILIIGEYYHRQDDRSHIDAQVIDRLFIFQQTTLSYYYSGIKKFI